MTDEISFRRAVRLLARELGATEVETADGRIAFTPPKVRKAGRCRYGKCRKAGRAYCNGVWCSVHVSKMEWAVERDVAVVVAVVDDTPLVLFESEVM